MNKKIKLSSLKGTEEYTYIKNLEASIKDAQEVLDRFLKDGKDYPAGYALDGTPETSVGVATRKLNELPKELAKFKKDLGVE